MGDVVDVVVAAVDEGAGVLDVGTVVVGGIVSSELPEQAPAVSARATTRALPQRIDALLVRVISGPLLNGLGLLDVGPVSCRSEAAPCGGCQIVSPSFAFTLDC